ncbi:uncharacterized protein [Euphorbia lathyris]|uniref:uncharacterized protein isoform X2 n=1 Tax=Euphorbia lathyris TaxID=212925 RepID=UPI0033131D9A
MENIKGWREGEASEDFHCKQSIPLIKIKNSSILRSVVRVYTLRMYKVFEDEFLNGIAKTWREVSSHENIYTFEVIVEEERDTKTRIVIFNADTIEISCSCKKFESIFRNHLTSRAYNLFFRSQRFETTRKICKDALTRIEMEVERELEKLNLEGDKVDDNVNPDFCDDNNTAILNPPRVKPKGVGNARLKGHFEKRKTRAKKGSKKLVKQKVTNVEDVVIQPIEISQRMVVPSQSWFTPIVSPENIPSSTTLSLSMQTMQQIPN